MGVPAHWTGSSHVTQAAIKDGSGNVSGRFHYPSNGNEQSFAVSGNTIDRFTSFSNIATLRIKGDVSMLNPGPTAHPQTKTHYEIASSVLWNLKLMGWSRYRQWLESGYPPRGSFWGRETYPGNYPAQAAAQNSYKFKSAAEPAYVDGGFSDFRQYIFATDGTVKDYFLWALLGGGTGESTLEACPDFTKSIYFPYFTTPGTYEEKQSQLAGWPTRHLSLSWIGDE
jgi:hypothetical protein